MRGLLPTRGVSYSPGPAVRFSSVCDPPSVRPLQVFLPANLSVGPSPGSLTSYATAFFSEAALLTRWSGWEAAEAQLEFVSALARQWFGVLIRPNAPEDTWLLEGLVEHMTWRVARKLVGNQEAAWRRRQQADAVVEADKGSLLPLAVAFSGVHRHMSADTAKLYRRGPGVALLCKNTLSVKLTRQDFLLTPYIN